MAEVIPNADRTLMGEIQHAVVNIIPDSENMQEVNLEAVKLQEVSESLVQSIEVEYALAKAHEISRGTVMEDVQNMASVGNGTNTYIALQSTIMESSNEEQKSLEQTTFNTFNSLLRTLNQGQLCKPHVLSHLSLEPIWTHSQA